MYRSTLHPSALRGFPSSCNLLLSHPPHMLTQVIHCSVYHFGLAPCQPLLLKRSHRIVMVMSISGWFFLTSVWVCLQFSSPWLPLKGSDVIPKQEFQTFFLVIQTIYLHIHDCIASCLTGTELVRYGKSYLKLYLIAILYFHLPSLPLVFLYCLPKLITLLLH